MGVRIAVVIAVGTLLSYLHMLQAVRTQALVQLEQSVAERTQREEAIFVLAEDNHALLKKALEERIRALQPEDVRARFERLFALLPDGTVRNRPEGFDGKRMVGLFVPRGVALDEELRRRILAAYDVLTQYGPAFQTRFTDTFITLPEGPNIVYWPGNPTYCQDAAPTESITAQEFFPPTLPENNPQRRTSWSGVYVEPVSKDWMVTVSTPLDVDGRQVAAISHDVLLQELMDRTASAHLPGAHNLLFRDDGQLIAHPELELEGATDVYNILAPPDAQSARLRAPEQREHLRHLFERVKEARPEKAQVLELAEQDAFLSVARLKGPGWYFATVMPKAVVSQPAMDAARYVLVFGVASLLLELGIMFWVLRQQISRPLLDFIQASERVAAGDFKVGLEVSREDELGRLARAFRRMADEVQRREEALKQANESLEQRVDQRTRELKDVHKQLLSAARQAGRAEIATSVLHNVGNVLNSVNTSALLARERLSGLQVEHVGRVATLLEERKDDLATFLTQDERGRHVRPFLSQLGNHLQEERRETLSLLDDVSRYTEHIGTIVKLQQDYTRTPRLTEPVALVELLEDALRINAAGLTRHAVKVERKLSPLPTVMSDKHKVLMILVNLISNAKYAMDSTPPEERCLTLTLEDLANGRIRIQVRDNGMGIESELLTRIFQYGFTTREEGHGFGLHSSALGAQELGGSLTAHSDGPGRGATFTLELPYERVEETQ
jgi:C4-dicarboxylate-specific signal transduction histidine kinase